MKKLALSLVLFSSFVNLASPLGMDGVYKFGRKTKGGLARVWDFEKEFHLVQLQNEGDLGALKRTAIGVTRGVGSCATIFNLASFICAMRGDDRLQLLTALKKKYGWTEEKSGRVVRWLLKHPKWSAFFQFVGIEVGLILGLILGFFATDNLVVAPGIVHGVAVPYGFHKGFTETV